METLILGWFVLVTTDSVILTAAFAALQFGGTLLSPFFGVIADRVDRKSMLITMRVGYTVLAAMIMTLGLIGIVTPWQLFIIAAISGLIRPSDLVIRHSLIADTFTTAGLRNAMGLSRTTMDTARIAGSLLGAGLLSSVGIGYAYGAVVGFYVASIGLAFGINTKHTFTPSGVRPWQELKLGFRYMLESEVIVAIMSLAFLVNLTAFPITHGLLPILARNVYGLDENGLARLVAFYASGALMGSLLIAGMGGASRPGRATVIAILLWYGLLAVFAQITTAAAGTLVIALIGCAQSFAMISMSVLLLSTTEIRYRGRVSGVRMLAVYGLPVGLILGGVLIEAFGTRATFTVYCAIGIVATGLIVLRLPALYRN